MVVEMEMEPISSRMGTNMLVKYYYFYYYFKFKIFIQI